MKPLSILPVFLGYAVSLGLGTFVCWAWVKQLWKRVEESKPDLYKICKEGSGFTTQLGILERFLYTSSVIAGFPEWIAVWLALKVAVGFFQTQKREPPTDNVYLIGNGLSVAFGVAGGMVARCCFVLS